MRKFILIPLLASVLFLNPAFTQQYKFYTSNTVKFLKQNNDSLRMPFTGGLNSPQFSNIDMNFDGIQDLFVFDRTANRISCFLRQGDHFIHGPQYEGLFPEMTVNFGADTMRQSKGTTWCTLADYDGDGDPDIYSETSLDRTQLVDTNQYPISNGLRIIKNISSPQKGLKFKQLSNQVMDTGGVYPGGFIRDPQNIFINNSDLPAIGDLDGDNDADILAFQLFDLTPHYWENYMVNPHHFPYDSNKTRFIFRDECWGDVQYDRTFTRNVFEIHKGQAEIGGCIYKMYEKTEKHTANSMMMIDFNGDGVQDIVYGDGLYKNLIVLINGRKYNSLGRDSIMSQDTAFPSNTTPANFIIWPAPYYVDINGDGLKELLVTTNEPNQAKSVNNVWTYDNTGTNEKPVFNYKGNDFFFFNESIDLGTGSVPVLVDIDGDGDQDLVVGTSGDYEKTNNVKDKLVLYKNVAKVNGNSVFALADSNFLDLSKDTPIIAMHPTFADINGDSKPDLLIGDYNGKILYYQNQGTGTQYNFVKQTSRLGNIDVGNCAAPAFWDLDKDGDIDMVIGNSDGYLKYFMNSGSATNPQFSSVATIDSFGKVLMNDFYPQVNGAINLAQKGYATPVLYDLDKDSVPELIVGAESGAVSIYSGVNLKPGEAFKRNNQVFVDYSHGDTARAVRFGRFSSPCVGLLDGDDKPDILVGNICGGLSFYANKKDTGIKPGGIADLSKKNQHFILYPNPVHDQLNITYDYLESDATYKIYNQMGQLVLQGKINHFLSENSVNISSLITGFYFIQLSGPDYNESIKFVIDQGR